MSRLILLIAICNQISTSGAVEENYWPTHGWRTATPEMEGIDSNVLAEALTMIREKKMPIHSLLIERNGFVILDAYFFPFEDGQTHDIASATKSIASTLIGIAIGEHKLTGVNQRILPIFSSETILDRNAQKERMTIGDFLTMRPGLDCHYDHGERTLNEMRASTHWVPFMLNLPMGTDPGTRYVYCSGGMHVLSGVISKVTGTNALAFAGRDLFEPLGIRNASWPSDPDGISDGWGDLHLHPRDMAKIGYLWLHNGRWQDRQIVPADYMRAAVQVHSRAPWGDTYGYGIWVYPNRQPPIFEANGRGGQRISVIPEKNMVVVMTGSGFEPGDVGALLFKAIKSDSALPQNLSGDARLSVAVLAATKAPAARTAAPLPAIARTISGNVYLLDDNVLGIKSLAMNFASSTATVSLAFADGRSETRPVGLDGKPRISAGSNGSQRVAVGGRWEDDRTFALDYDTIGDINNYKIGLTFSGTQVEVELHELTGLVNARVHGHRQ